MGRARVVTFAVLASCGPDVVEPAELEALCGQEGPVQILELSAEQPLFGGTETDRVDDRRIVHVGYASAEADEDGFPELERTEAWSVGMCGESPVRLDADGAFRYADVWPDVLLGCRESAGDIVTLDPLGLRAPHVVMHTQECSGARTAYGLVFLEEHDEDTGALVLLPWVDDPWTETAEPRVLVDPIRTHPEPPHRWSYVGMAEVREDAVFALTTEDEVVRVSLTDATRTIEATSVRDFDVSEDGRWLIWQDLQPTSDDEDWPPGAIYLKDRVDGTTTHLADLALTGSFPSALEFIDHGIVPLLTGYIDRDPERIFFLPDMATIDLPVGDHVEHRLDDGRWLVGTRFGGPYTLYDPELLQSRPFFPAKGSIAAIGDGVEFFADDGFLIDYHDEFDREAPVWFVPWDGPRELLAARALKSYVRLRDGRIITAVDVDHGDAWLGTLIVAASHREDERVIDHHVLPWSTVSEVDEAIVYGVRDGDRTGVWLTKLAGTTP